MFSLSTIEPSHEHESTEISEFEGQFMETLENDEETAMDASL